MSRLRDIGVAAGLSIAVLLAGCGSEPDQQVSHAIAHAPDPTLGAESVITSALTRLFTWFPAREANTRPAFDRAKPLLGPPLGAATGPGAPLSRSIEWGHWAAEKITVVAQVQIVSDEHPPDTPRSVSRVVKVTQQPTDRTGKTSGAPKVLTAWAVATSPIPGKWLMTSIRI